MRSRQTFGIYPENQETFFAHPQNSSSAPYPQELNSTWKKTIEEPIHMSTAEEKWKTRTRPRSEMPVWTVSQRFSHLQWRRLFTELWADQQRLQISDLQFDKFPTPATFACWKIRFTISYGSNAMDQGSGVG